MNKIDRLIIKRIVITTFMILVLLIFIFIIIDFSENSDDFTDRGAAMKEIWGDYYLNYIPEIIRLILPVAMFVSVLLITGQMADRVEIIALKSAGVSLFRFLRPFILVGIIAMTLVSYIDGYVVPPANAVRFTFERMYINSSSDRIDRNMVFRQESPKTVIQISYFDKTSNTAYKVILYDYLADTLKKMTDLSRMVYIDSTHTWKMHSGIVTTFTDFELKEQKFQTKDSTLNIIPKDLARTTTDIYQLTYPEIVDYINSISRTGAKGIELPQVQFYSKLSYPLSIPIVTIIGVCLAFVRRKGGKGAYLALGLGISFIYLALMKITEPLGYSGTLAPMTAAVLPHLIFFIVSVILIKITKK